MYIKIIFWFEFISYFPNSTWRDYFLNTFFRDNYIPKKCIVYNQRNGESAKSRAWRACVLACLTCLRAWRAYVLGVLTCSRAYVLGVLACSRAWRAHVLGVLACSRAWRACVLACLRGCACVCKCVLVCLICFAFQYLNLKILTAKNCVLC